MKLLNNFLSLGYGAIYAEALTLAQKVGITPQTFDSVITGGRMECGFYRTFMQYVLERDPDAHKFTLSNALKDVRYLESLANAAGVPNPVGGAVKNVYAAAVASGKGEDYVPMLSLISSLRRARSRSAEPGACAMAGRAPGHICAERGSR
jgi:3-hydroxyisobutyrate dehydrogenase-like beta-hydroxyacid dehydrogenase